jgi:hypothetical protein
MTYDGALVHGSKVQACRAEPKRAPGCCCRANMICLRITEASDQAVSNSVRAQFCIFKAAALWQKSCRDTRPLNQLLTAVEFLARGNSEFSTHPLGSAEA